MGLVEISRMIIMVKMQTDTSDRKKRKREETWFKDQILLDFLRVKTFYSGRFGRRNKIVATIAMLAITCKNVDQHIKESIVIQEFDIRILNPQYR